METLKDVIDGWGKSDAFNEAWMDTLRAYYAK
jgi:simple sugar transport system substrate-binding protein